ncbi:MFS transporter [Pseudarthrobacter sp. fls2-241-R2A-168]|uniref:MFS transporter n=1 Tax=Pseudarthrobacter sp. fls2-241-R2A-168 TaxID=3040304 RepID=UPI0025533B46|nr:MFS transporter [Pseudarthrobacter sp. fls2-241-R2A-168]
MTNMASVARGAAAGSGKPTSEFRRNSGVIIGGLVAYTGGPIIISQTQSIMIAPVMSATGLPATAVTLSPWILLFMGLLSPMVGRLLSHYSPRPLAIIAVVANVIALALLAVLPASWASFWTVGFAVSIIGSLGYWATLSRMMSFWYRKNLGLVIGLVGGGASLIPLVLLPIMTSVIYGPAGWRGGYWCLAAYVGLISLPLVLVFFRKPEKELFADDLALAASNTENHVITGLLLHDIFRDARFWLLSISWFVISIGIGGFITNMAAVGIERGFSPTFATGLSMALLIGTLLGRVFGGAILDRGWPYFGPIVIFALSGLGALGLAFLPAATPVLFMLVIAAVLGLSMGAEGDYLAFFALREFGARNFSFINGVFLVMAGVGAFIGGFSFAVVRDVTGSYAGATTYVSLTYFGGSALVLIAGLFSIAARKRGAQFYAGKDAANLDL